MYLMISTYLAPLDEVDKARDDHSAYLEALERRGLIVAAGRQDPPSGGIILFDTDSEEDARALLADDPYVQRGLAEYRAIGWKPTRGVLAGWTRRR